MTVPVQTPFTASVANGVTTVFPYGFMIASSGDLAVTLNGVLQTSGYSVSGVGNPAGGNVTFTVAPINGVSVVRYLEPVLKRDTDYQQFGDWTADVVDNDFDRIWLALQAISQSNARSLKLPKDTAADQVITQDAAARIAKLVSFDASGNMMLVAPLDAALVATASAFILTLFDDPDAPTARATLGFDPLDPQLSSLIRQVSKSIAYTTVLTDGGKHILHPTADNNARTFTIDSNANVAYPIGTAITFVNQINTVTIAITADVLTLQGAGTTGSRTLAANGIATALKIDATHWVISGTGLT